MKRLLLTVFLIMTLLFISACGGNNDNGSNGGDTSGDGGLSDGSGTEDNNGGSEDGNGGSEDGNGGSEDGNGDSDSGNTGTDEEGDGTGNGNNVDGGDGSGSEDGGNEDNEPDYGTSTVYTKGSQVYLVGSPGEKTFVSAFSSALGNTGIDVIYSSAIYEKYEIIIGETVDRDITRVAYDLLSKLPKSSYFNARYLVYASSGKIAIAYDYNEYTPISALEYINDTLIDYIIGDGDYVALTEGVITSGTVDLIEEQRKLDEVTLANAWAQLKASTTPEIYEAFRTLYTMYDDKMIEWYANLYDPAIGAYYETTSEKNTDCYLPNPESTIQALRFLESSGLLDGLGKYQDNIPEIMKHKIIYYCKSIQDPNGYFYDPQYGKHSSNGRHLSWCTNMLKLFGSAPVYDTPNGHKGDGISADEYWDSLGIDEVRPYNLPAMKEIITKPAYSLTASTSESVSKVILAATTTDYLTDYRAYIDYIYSIDVDTDPYTGCGIFNGIYSQIAAQSNVLYNKQGRFVFLESYGERYRMYDGMTLKEITIAYFNSKINPATGLIGQPSYINPKGTEYLFTNGFFKMIAVYNSFGAEYPAAEKATEALLQGIISDEASKQNICDVYNVWEGLYNLRLNVSKYGASSTRAQILEKIDSKVQEYGAEAILKSYEKMKDYKMPDGGFASSTKRQESNVDAIGKPHNGMVSPMCNLLGVKKIPMYTRHQLMKYYEILFSLENPDKVYFKPLESFLTFDDMPDASQLSIRSATADLSIEEGRDGNPALLINKNQSKDQTIIDMSVMEHIENPTGILFETDIKFSDVQAASHVAFTFGKQNGGHADRTYRYQFKVSKADGATLSFQEMKWSGLGSNFSSVGEYTTKAKVGEWFKLKIEYDMSEYDANGCPEIRIYIDNELIHTTNIVYSKSIDVNSPAAQFSIIMFTPMVCKLWLDNTVIKQFN